MEQEDRIKSAREIAMEKMAGMSGLTPEELSEQREKEYGPRGAAIAGRYLEGILRSTELEHELHRYQGKEGEVVRKAFCSTLCESISLEDMTRSLKAVDAIEAVAGQSDLSGARREIESASEELRQKLEQGRAVYEDLERKKLRDLGISGSAVRPNVSESEEWREELRRIESGYGEKLAGIRQSLAETLGI